MSSRRSAVFVAAGMLCSRLAGLVRTRVFSHYFGLQSDSADAFNAAFRIPNFLQNLFGEGALSGLARLAGFRRVLLDGPAGGGGGVPFAWSLARRARELHGGELFVSGGLTADNVAQAIRSAAPDGVDVASGIEGADGFKDPVRVRAFVAAVRGAEGEGE